MNKPTLLIDPCLGVTSQAAGAPLGLYKATAEVSLHRHHPPLVVWRSSIQ